LPNFSSVSHLIVHHILYEYVHELAILWLSSFSVDSSTSQHRLPDVQLLPHSAVSSCPSYFLAPPTPPFPLNPYPRRWRYRVATNHTCLLYCLIMGFSGRAACLQVSHLIIPSALCTLSFQAYFLLLPSMWCRDYYLWLYLCHSCRWFLLLHEMHILH